MGYIIYKKITETEFGNLKSRLVEVEKISSLLMQQNAFHLNLKDYSDVLSLDYVQEDENFMGNIGIGYDQEKSNGEKLFEFYVLKAHDANKRRFFKKYKLPALYSIEEVEANFMDKLQDCILKYNSWKREDLTEFIDL